MIEKLIEKMKHTSPSVYISIFIGIIVLLLMADIYSLLGDELGESSIVQDQPYDVLIGDVQYENTDLSALRFPKLRKGTKITYTTRLKGETEGPLLRVYCKHSMMSIYIDDQKMYSYGEPEWRLFGYGYLTIPLNSGFEGKTLRVEQLVMESGEVGAFKLPVIYNGDNYMYQLINSKRLYLIFDIGMIVLGLAVILVSIIFMYMMPEIKKLLWMSIAFCGVGLWVFCSSNLITLFVHNDPQLRGYLEYLSLYISPVFFLLYFIDDNFRKESNRILRGVYATLLTTMIVFPTAAVILHFTDVVHLPRILPVCHILLGIIFAYTLFTIIRQIVLKRFGHPVMLIGTLVLILVCISDMVNYFVYKYSSSNPDSEYNSMMLLGLFLFAVCLIVDFFTSQKKSILMEAKSQALEKIAYVDVMTGLYNRHRCDKEIASIADLRGRAVFGILNFDLNDLKKTNDTYGHMAGDELIIDFSTALKEVFSSSGLTGRMGGDEFIVIFSDMTGVDVQKLIDEFYGKLDERNKSRKGVLLSGAYGLGVADGEDLKRMQKADEQQRIRIVQEVYRRADRNMYENKAKMKCGR